MNRNTRITLCILGACAFFAYPFLVIHEYHPQPQYERTVDDILLSSDVKLNQLDLRMLRTDIERLDTRVNAIDNVFNLEVLNYLKGTELNVNTHTFAYVETSDKHWTFPIAVENVEPYLAGVKVKLNIGNPYIATFSNATIECDFGASEKIYKTTSTKLTDNLEPNKWNDAEVILTPIQPDAFTFLRIRISTSTISLR